MDRQRSGLVLMAGKGSGSQGDDESELEKKCYIKKQYSASDGAAIGNDLTNMWMIGQPDLTLHCGKMSNSTIRRVKPGTTLF